MDPKDIASETPQVAEYRVADTDTYFERRKRVQREAKQAVAKWVVDNILQECYCREHGWDQSSAGSRGSVLR